MRLPYPEHLKTKHVAMFIALLFLGQMLEGTDVGFASLVSLYIVLFTLAFNTAGGLYYSSGAYVFLNGVLTAILGLVYKLFLFEPGEKNLLDARKSMLCYCAVMFAMWMAVTFSHRLTPRRGNLASIASGEMMLQSAIGSLMLGTVLMLLFGSQQAASGSIGSAINQLNRFPQVAIILGTAYEVRKSGGRRCGNWVVYGAVFLLFAIGVIYTSKEGMLIGPTTWMLAAVALRYNFRIKPVLVIGFFAFIMFYYLIPYSQYARRFRDEHGNRAANQATALQYLSNPEEVRRLYKETTEDNAEDYYSAPHLYDREQGFMDRLNMLAYDDTLIWYTDQGNVFGLLPTWASYANVVPHFIWRNKPTWGFGNDYGREIGVLAADDVTTGISFSPVGDGYHQARWVGLLLVWPIIFFLYCLVTDSIVGSIRDSPWPLLPIALLSHFAPEGGMQAPIQQETLGVVGLYFIAWTAKYVFPVVVRILSGGDKVRVQRTQNLSMLGRTRTPLQSLTPQANADTQG